MSLLLADAAANQTIAPWRTLSASVVGGLLLISAIGSVTLLAVLWAMYFRKKKRRKRKHHSHHESSPPTAELEAADAEPSEHHHRHRRRRKRRDHRPRNPTLAETGGLPPIRSDSAAGPQP